MNTPNYEILGNNPTEQMMSPDLRDERMEVIQETEDDLHALSDDVQKQLRAGVMVG